MIIIINYGQAVEEMAISFADPQKGDFYQCAFVAMAEPEYIISFRVPQIDNKGALNFNRG